MHDSPICRVYSGDRWRDVQTKTFTWLRRVSDRNCTLRDGPEITAAQPGSEPLAPQ